MQNSACPEHRPFEALLLDLDGTVADTHELMYRCYSYAVQEHSGYEGSRQVWDRCAGLPLTEVFTVTYTDVKHPVPELRLFIQSYRTQMSRIHDEAVTVFPGIPETLEALKSHGIRLGIVTTKYQAAALRHLQFLGLADYFDAVITGDQCKRFKPHPEPFRRALEAIAVDPGSAAGVGDSVYDIQGARAAGLFSVAACWGTRDRSALLCSSPDWIAEDPTALLQLLAPSL